MRISTTKVQTILSPFPSSGRRGIFQGDTVWLESDNGKILTERSNARSAFHSFRHLFWWDNLDLLYFAGYALWNYFCTPFLFQRPGFEVTEIEPWEERDERWRRLKVIFPSDIPTHCREQIFYFDAKGLLRRLDYTANVFGKWAKAAHYCWEHRDFSGLIVPTRRRVFFRKGTGQPRPLPTFVWIVVEDMRVVRA